MEKSGKPVPTKLAAVEKIARQVAGIGEPLELDFNDTQIAFSGRDDKELKKMAWLFGLMNKHWLVGIGSKIGLAAVKMHLPFVEGAVKNTIFEQFCGGTTLLDSQKTINRLGQAHIFSVLDYGAEGKDREEEFNFTMNEAIRALDFGSQNDHVKLISLKITGMARFGLLEDLHADQKLTQAARNEYDNVVKRLDAICHAAAQKGMSVLIDAEESWIQKPLDNLANMMMERYNQERPVVYNTFQMYRIDRLDYLKASFEQARAKGYILGAKLVRGAYMEKERDRAEELGYPSPIHPTKALTDQHYNDGIRFCVDNYQYMACCNASHNAQSVLLQAEMMHERQIPRNHPHLLFCQLQGMSDNLTYNLAHAGFNVGKYVVYGQIRDVVPYLIRRAQENTSITGDMSREYSLVLKEMKRRGLA
ncbi:MAG: proline dehydrogenase family protein [Lewinellaceae bacterium]|nr:proline dehydrogenase family protein [Lewinellaceae bacterium]